MRRLLCKGGCRTIGCRRLKCDSISSASKFGDACRAGLSSSYAFPHIRWLRVFDMSQIQATAETRPSSDSQLNLAHAAQFYHG